MNKRELYALLDIESPEEFEYFENLADYLECEEELDYTDVAELFNGVNKDVLAQLCDNYFEEISGFVPGSQTEDLYHIRKHQKGSGGDVQKLQ